MIKVSKKRLTLLSPIKIQFQLLPGLLWALSRITSHLSGDLNLSTILSFFSCKNAQLSLFREPTIVSYQFSKQYGLIHTWTDKALKASVLNLWVADFTLNLTYSPIKVFFYFQTLFCHLIFCKPWNQDSYTFSFEIEYNEARNHL